MGNAAFDSLEAKGVARDVLVLFPEPRRAAKCDGALIDVGPAGKRRFEMRAQAFHHLSQRRALSLLLRSVAGEWPRDQCGDVAAGGIIDIESSTERT